MRKVRILEHAILHSFGKFLRLDQYDVSYPLFGGDMSKTQSLVNVHRKDSVAGLLHIVGHQDRHSLLLVEQFRLPTLIRAKDGMPDLDRVNEENEQAGRIIELVAGAQKPGEPWLETFRRECQEETEFVPDRIEFICSYYPSPGACSEQIHLYYGRIEWPEGHPWPETEPPGTRGHGEITEDIRKIFVTPSEFLDMVSHGKLHDGKCLAAAEWMRRNLGVFGLAPASPTKEAE